MLMLPAENLNGRRDLSTFSYRCLSQDAVASDIDSGADARFRMSKERAKRNPAGHVALDQSQVIIGNPKVVADSAGNRSTRLREKCVDRLHPAKAGQRSGRRCSDEKCAIQTLLKYSSDHDFIVPVSFALNLISGIRTRCTLVFRRWLAAASK